MDFFTADGRGVDGQDPSLFRGDHRHNVVLHELFDFLAVRNLHGKSECVLAGVIAADTCANIEVPVFEDGQKRSQGFLGDIPLLFVLLILDSRLEPLSNRADGCFAKLGGNDQIEREIRRRRSDDAN